MIDVAKLIERLNDWPDMGDCSDIGLTIDAATALRLLWAECKAWRAAWDDRDHASDGNADPAHRHALPGIWDQGGPCTSCERFFQTGQKRMATDAALILEPKP